MLPLNNNTLNKLLAGLGAGILLFYIFCELGVLNSGFTGDFPHFYAAARALIVGDPLYASGTGGYIYPPFFAFLITPLAHFSEKTACMLWQGVNLCLIVLIFILGFRVLASGLQLKLNRWQALGACALALILSYHELWWEFKWAQTDLFILAGFALSLYWLDRKPYLAGACLGVIANVKYQSLLFLPFLLLRARWRAILGLLVGGVAAALLPALMIGWQRNLEYLTIALRGIINMPGPQHLSRDYAARVPDMLWGGNISITSGMARIFVDHGLSKSAALIVVFAIACVMFFILWSLFRRYNIPFLWRTPRTLNNPQQEKLIITLEWSAILLIMLIFSPQCNIRHLILILNVNLLAVLMLLYPRPNVKRWPILTGILIFQFGKLFDDLIAHPLHLPWSYFGGPCWTLLIFLPLIISTGLAYCRDLYPESLSIQSPSEKVWLSALPCSRRGSWW